jgi:hypothetical protein
VTPPRRREAPRIGLVTCRRIPEPDGDEEVLLGALARAGAAPEMLAWDDPAADAGRYSLCVLRSAWNYFVRPQEFEAWATAAAARCALWNPLPVLRWNLRKTYLRQLERQGIPITPTRWLAGGSAELEPDPEWPEFVVKPTISAGSFLTRRFPADRLAEAREFVAAEPAREWMVQRYMREVETSGERAIVAIDGEVTHSVRKSPRFTGDPERVSPAIAPSPDERLFAERTLAAVGERLLYARVDVIRDDDGALRLAELEVIEPSLFLRCHPPALERFVSAILAKVPR